MTSRWFVVFTHPLMELTAERELKNQGFEVLLPLYWKIRSHAGRKDKVKRAAFPCYLFAKFDSDSAPWRSINGTRGVVRLICQGEIPIPISDAQIDVVKAMIGKDGMVEISKLPKYYVDQLLQVKGGIWVDRKALFVAAKDGLLTLSIDILGRTVQITVPEDQVTA